MDDDSGETEVENQVGHINDDFTNYIIQEIRRATARSNIETLRLECIRCEYACFTLSRLQVHMLLRHQDPVQVHNFYFWSLKYNLVCTTLLKHGQQADNFSKNTGKIYTFSFAL